MHDMLEMHILQGYEKDAAHSDEMCMELAEAYVRRQPLDALFEPEESLKRGTIFPNLCRPYKGWTKIPACS